MTVFEQMKTVLRDSELFTEEQIAQLFADAHTGRHLRYSDEDDESSDEDNTIGNKPVVKKKTRFRLNGDMANEFNDSYPEDEEDLGYRFNDDECRGNQW